MNKYLKFKKANTKDEKQVYDVIDPDGCFSYGRLKYDYGFKNYLFSCAIPSKIPSDYLREIANFIDKLNNRQSKDRRNKMKQYLVSEEELKELLAIEYLMEGHERSKRLNKFLKSKKPVKVIAEGYIKVDSHRDSVLYDSQKDIEIIVNNTPLEWIGKKVIILEVEDDR